MVVLVAIVMDGENRELCHVKVQGEDEFEALAELANHFYLPLNDIEIMDASCSGVDFEDIIDMLDDESEDYVFELKNEETGKIYKSNIKYMDYTNEYK